MHVRISFFFQLSPSQDKKEKTKNNKGKKPKNDKEPKTPKPKNQGDEEKEAKVKLLKDAKKARGLSLCLFLLVRLFTQNIFHYQAASDASNKLKWAISLMPAMEAMPETQLSSLPQSAKIKMVRVTALT